MSSPAANSVQLPFRGWIRGGFIACLISCVLEAFVMIPADRVAVAEEESASGPAAGVILLAARPGVPTEVAELLERGRVTFVTGSVRPSRFRKTPSTGASNQHFDAETQFHLQYEFDGRCRYGWDGRELWIRPRFPMLRLRVEHEVWFRDQTLATETVDAAFWKLPLVQHELDHVRISSHPNLIRMFRDQVLDQRVLRFDLDRVRELGTDASVRRGDPLEADVLRRLINDHVRQQFEAVVELVAIRYRELDRVTHHGQENLPADHRVWTWMR